MLVWWNCVDKQFSFRSRERKTSAAKEKFMDAKLFMEDPLPRPSGGTAQNVFDFLFNLEKSVELEMKALRDKKVR